MLVYIYCQFKIQVVKEISGYWFCVTKGMIFSSKCIIKRLTVRLYLNPLMGEFTALPRLTGFRGGPVGPGKGREEGVEKLKGGPHFCKRSPPLVG